MNGFLVDTNCISELVRVEPEPRVIEWFKAADESLLFISVLTLGELRKGIAILSHGKRRTLLETWIEIELRSRFSGRVLAVDSEIADRWGLLAAQARSKGISLPIIDGLLAATALHHNLTVVSRNSSDFTSAQVPVLNPWDD